MFGWSPGIGDPTLVGWVTVAAHLSAAALCARASKVAPSHLRNYRTVSIRTLRQGQFWRMLAIVLIALGINKQLDLQSLVTAAGRTLAREQGWYANRRQVQGILIWVITGLGLLALSAIAVRMRRADRRVRLASIGIGLLIVFVVVRAASFHHFDLLLKAGVGGVRLNHLIELGGIGAIALAAILPPSQLGRDRSVADRDSQLH